MWQYLELSLLWKKYIVFSCLCHFHPSLCRTWKLSGPILEHGSHFWFPKSLNTCSIHVPALRIRIQRSGLCVASHVSLYFLSLTLPLPFIRSLTFPTLNHTHTHTATHICIHIIYTLKPHTHTQTILHTCIHTYTTHTHTLYHTHVYHNTQYNTHTHNLIYWVTCVPQKRGDRLFKLFVLCFPHL